MLIDPDVLREYGHECDRSAGQVASSHGVLFQDSIIWRDAWDGGGFLSLVWLLGLQGTLDDMRETYDGVRERMLDRITAVVDDLRVTNETLVTLAREADEGEEITGERLGALWP